MRRTVLTSEDPLRSHFWGLEHNVDRGAWVGWASRASVQGQSGGCVGRGEGRRGGWGGVGRAGHLGARLDPQHAVQVHVEAPLVDGSLPSLCHWLRCAAVVRAGQILLPCNTILPHYSLSYRT